MSFPPGKFYKALKEGRHAAFGGSDDDLDDADIQVAASFAPGNFSNANANIKDSAKKGGMNSIEIPKATNERRASFNE